MTMIYRFRPRTNKAVNGWFMCDYGRLSYENDATNRFENPLLNKIETNVDNTITNMFKELSTNKNILFVLSANLSIEEMQNVKNLASKLNANTSGYSPNTYDENFADDYLKKADRTANRAAFKELEINETKEHFEEKLNAATLVIIVENNFFDNNEKLLENKKVISLFSHLNETIKYSNIAIPVASFYEKSGTYINTNGIKQKVISKMNKNNPMQTITTIIEHLKSMIEKGTL
jgi:NADH-quinone oxidoreductase subunit G